MEGTIVTKGVIKGTIQPKSSLKGTLQPKPCLKGTIIPSKSSEYPVYTGPTEITSSFEAQTLSVAHKVMVSDITVEAIPTYETSNEFGTTFII